MLRGPITRFKLALTLWCLPLHCVRHRGIDRSYARQLLDMADGDVNKAIDIHMGMIESSPRGDDAM